MFKRLFFTAVGLGAGVALGVWAVRKLEETQRKMTPDHLAGAAGDRVSELRGRLATAVAEGRAAAADKEAELRAVYRVRRVEDLAAEAERLGDLGAGG
jgi:hypothetical protein